MFAILILLKKLFDNVYKILKFRDEEVAWWYTACLVGACLGLHPQP